MFLGCLSCFANTKKRKENEKRKENDVEPIEPIYYERGYFFPFLFIM